MVPRFGTYGFLKSLIFFDPFIILFLREQGISFFGIGLLIAVRELVTNLTEIPTGVIADIWGRRRAMLASFASYIASFALFYWSSHFWLFAAAMVCFGLGEAFRSGTHKAMIMEYQDRQEGQRASTVAIFGFVRSWSQIGAALSTLLAAGLVFMSGQYRILFIASMLPYILAALLIITYPRELDGRDRSPLARPSWRRFLADTLRRVWQQPRLRRAVLNSALDKSLYKTTKDYLQPVIAAGALLLFPFLPALLPDLGDKQTIAVAVALIYSSLYLIGALASARSERIEKALGGGARALNRTFALYLVIMAVAWVSLWHDWWWLTVLGFLFIGAIQNARRPMIISFLGQHMQANERATVMSVETQVQTLLTLILAPLIGAFTDLFGLSAVFMVGLVVFSGLGYLVRCKKD